MSILNLPKRISLGVEAVNFILDYGEQIFDGIAVPENMDDRVAGEIEALHRFFLAGERASWRIAVSSFVYKKVLTTKDPSRCYFVENWLNHVRERWVQLLRQECFMPTLVEAENIRAELYASDSLSMLNDRESKLLVADAVVQRCELICSRDFDNLLVVRDRIAGLPVEIVTPMELWERVSAYAHIWED